MRVKIGPNLSILAAPRFHLYERGKNLRASEAQLREEFAVPVVWLTADVLKYMGKSYGKKVAIAAWNGLVTFTLDSVKNKVGHWDESI